MRIVRQLLLVCVMAGVLGAFGAGSALAANCGGAGGQQYIDPLQCGGGTPGNNHSSGGNSNGGGGGTTSTPTTSTTPTGTSSASDTSTTTSTTSAGTTTSSTSTSKSDPKTLPYTGLDLGPALLIAFGLLGGGLVLRRVVTDR